MKRPLTARKIILRLTSKQRQRHKNAKREYERLQHYPALIETRYHTDTVGFEACEAGEEDEVGWVALAFPEGEQHEADGAEEGDPEHPLVGLDPGAVGF